MMLDWYLETVVVKLRWSYYWGGHNYYWSDFRLKL